VDLVRQVRQASRDLSAQVGHWDRWANEEQQVLPDPWDRADHFLLDLQAHVVRLEQPDPRDSQVWPVIAVHPENLANEAHRDQLDPQDERDSLESPDLVESPERRVREVCQDHRDHLDSSDPLESEALLDPVVTLVLLVWLGREVREDLPDHQASRDWRDLLEIEVSPAQVAPEVSPACPER